MAGHAVIIPSTNRQAILHDTLMSVAKQQPPAMEILVSVVKAEDASKESRRISGVRVIAGRRGAATQRNDAIAAISPGVDYVTFLDDDVELATDYLLHARELLRQRSDVVVVEGTLLANGGINRAAAAALIENAAAAAKSVIPVASPYGCNMTVRRALLNTIRFDERFRLNCWLEDSDFGFSCKKHGNIARYEACRAVHLMTPSARGPGVQMGFAQIMNSYYLMRKGHIRRTEMMRSHWLPSVRNNLVKWLLRDKKTDRWGRLRGNLTAFSLIARGRCEPEHIETL